MYNMCVLVGSSLVAGHDDLPYKTHVLSHHYGSTDGRKLLQNAMLLSAYEYELNRNRRFEFPR